MHKNDLYQLVDFFGWTLIEFPLIGISGGDCEGTGWARSEMYQRSERQPRGAEVYRVC